MTDEIRSTPDPIPAPAAKPREQRVNKFAERRAEIKRHKRKAHRRKIGASNRPG